jgi:hypothetical protein
MFALQLLFDRWSGSAREWGCRDEVSDYCVGDGWRIISDGRRSCGERTRRGRRNTANDAPSCDDNSNSDATTTGTSTSTSTGGHARSFTAGTDDSSSRAHDQAARRSSHPNATEA